MKIKTNAFRVREGATIKLTDWPTRVKPLYRSKAHYQELLETQVSELSELQQLLYATDCYALLLIFQGMDAAGKDSAIRHVMSGVNPQGCQVATFKAPSVTELDHDFLWRTTQHLPERGRIGIFNRSYYEEVLIVRVHPELLNRQGLPHELLRDKSIWRGRYRSIIDFENHLHRNGTRTVKFFLHLSPEEQGERLLKRIDQPDKSWKFTRADLNERKHWPKYMKAYEACLSATSTKLAPWYVIPADDKANARLIVSRIIIETLESLRMHYPKPGASERKELQEIRKRLRAEQRGRVKT